MTKISVGSFALGIAVALLGAAPTAAQVSDCTGQPAGVACTDTDNNNCTAAACDGAGNCNQTQGLIGAGLTVTGCSDAFDTDNDPCTSPACDGAGACNQGQILPTGNGCTDPEETAQCGPYLLGSSRV